MAMPNADHGMSAVKVKIFLTFVVPYFCVFALDNVNVKERIYVE